MSFTIFQNEKTSFQAIKTRSSKSRKIDIIAKGLTHDFRLKMAVFPTFIYYAVQARKMCFTIFQNEKTPLQAIKTRTSKSRKIDIFPKWLTHGHGPKMALFPTFFLSKIGHENVFYEMQEQINAFLCYKNKKFKKSKTWHFFKGVNPCCLVYKWPFIQVLFFRQYRPGKFFLRYSTSKKRLCSL